MKLVYLYLENILCKIKQFDERLEEHKKSYLVFGLKYGLGFANSI